MIQITKTFPSDSKVSWTYYPGARTFQIMFYMVPETAIPQLCNDILIVKLMERESLINWLNIRDVFGMLVIDENRRSQISSEMKDYLNKFVRMLNFQ